MQLKPGHLLHGGKYRIIRTLGQGGFGITYEADQVGLGRIVAVKEFFMRDCCEREAGSAKMIVPTQSNVRLVDKFKGKFIREAKLIASYDNPHIVRVLDVFEENNTAYYVMENLPGGSLAEKVKKEGPLAESVAEEYVCQVADALSYIHERNTVHLDVKPSNILLNGQGQAVLIDFGISKHYDEAGEQTSTTPIGYSPGYAPIEQNRVGKVSQFKASTDIYALGATLYYLVTGQTPPDASVVYEEGLDRPYGISDRIWQTITKSMQDKRANRPQTVSSFLSILNQDNEEDTIPILPGDDKKGPTPTRKRRLVLFLLPACGILLLLLFWRSNWVSFFSEPRVYSGNINDHEWVDLGLSVKWATCNVGASSPYELGNYFAWGETSTKDRFEDKNYRFFVSRGDPSKVDGNIKYSKYVCDNLSHGVIDNMRRLVLQDDAANANWGGTWRMATDIEWAELKQHCRWTWIEQTDKVGYEIVSKKNGNSIFLPVSRRSDYGFFGFYWSASLRIDFSSHSWGLCLRPESVNVVDYNRDGCGSIRPVTK